MKIYRENNAIVFDDEAGFITQVDPALLFVKTSGDNYTFYRTTINPLFEPISIRSIKKKSGVLYTVNEFNLFLGTNGLLDYFTPRTGWAQYADTIYTTSSPFSVLEGSTVTLENNAGTKIESQLNGNTPFYDPTTKKVTPMSVGDAYTISVRFKARTSVTGDFMSVGLDIGAPLGVIIEKTEIFTRGAGNQQFISVTFPIYSLNTFKANGGTIKVTSYTGNLEIYDIVYVIIRTHEGVL